MHICFTHPPSSTIFLSQQYCTLYCCHKSECINIYFFYFIPFYKLFGNSNIPIFVFNNIYLFSFSIVLLALLVGKNNSDSNGHGRYASSGCHTMLIDVCLSPLGNNKLCLGQRVLRNDLINI